MVSEEQHMALPRLYGGPAYSRPPRPVEVLARPFDPDELPLEADRTDDDIALVNELNGATWAPASAAPVKAKARRGRAAKEAARQAAAQAAVPAGVAQGSGTTPEGESAGLQGRPFSLRGLGRIFGSDRK
jgi:hypothetical protein